MKIAYFSLAGLPDFKEHGDFSILKPASWSNPEADPAPKALTGRPELVKQIREVLHSLQLKNEILLIA